MAGTDDEIPATAADVIAELNSGYERRQACGPLKEINGVELVSCEGDIVRRQVRAVIVVHAYQESPYGDCANTQRVFNLSQQDIARLAQAAPMFRPYFEEAARRVDPEKTALADRIAAVESWCDQGLPTQQSTSVLKPLRWKR